jgi:hypothetical protein
MKTVALIVTLLFSATGISQQQPTKPHDVAMDKWRSMISAIENVLKEHNLHCDYPGGLWAPSIVDAADFSSTDHMSAALVDWCNGGAYSDAILAVNLEDGKPVLSRFLTANDQEQSVGFLSGSSVMHSVGVKLVPGKNALFDSQCDYAESEGVFHCKVTAYVWNPTARAFKLDMKLGRQSARPADERGLPLAD